MAQPSPSLRRRRLGAALRELREAAGRTRDEVGAALDCSASKISRIENGDVGVRRGDLLTMLDLYGVGDPQHRDELVELARQSKERGGWWLRYGQLPSPYVRLIGLEQSSRSIRTFQLTVVPGLLQTEEYARALTRARRPTDSPQEVERRVQVRLARQALLRRDEPPLYQAVLDEAVLHRMVGGLGVLRGQLERLAAINDQGNVSVRVLPFSSGGHEATTGAFTILEFAEPADPDLVFVEGFAGDVYLDDKPDIARSKVVFDHLCTSSLSVSESINLIWAIAKGSADG